jgi:dolichol-phosphate mannosyltransferase
MDHPPLRPSLSLILPAFNEEAGIAEAILEADEALAKIVGEYEILVVDDGSTDATAERVAGLTAQLSGLRLISHDTNRGYGAALRTGFEAARMDRVAFTDADCQFDLADLGPLLHLSDEVPVAVGYRVGRQDPWQRRFFSWGYNVLVRALLGTRVRDCDCALKVFRREALTQLLPEEPGYFVNTEMLTRARLLGLHVAEVGVRHRPRRHGHSKVGLGDIPRTLRTLLPYWWSKVLFPALGECNSPKGTSPRGVDFAAVLVLLAVAGLLFFSRLTSPLLEPEEARYAEIPRQMLAEGRFAEPVLHGVPYYQKPPLFYWLVMLCYAAFGPHDWAARLVPATAGVLTVLVTYLWGRRSVGTGTGLVGALLLCLSARYVYSARMLTLDGLLCLWVVLGLASGHFALRENRWRWWAVSALACGLGVLTKGPVALVLVTLPLLLLQFFDRRVRAHGVRGWLGYFGLALGLAGGWYVAMAVHQPEAAREFLWEHHFLRFVAPLDHAQPLWFYLPGIFLGLMPWSLLLWPLGKFVLRKARRTAARRPQALGVFLLASLWCLVFFSIAGCKRAGYVLPALPPLALALGFYLNLLEGAWQPAPGLAALFRRPSALAGQATLVVLALSAVCAAAAVVTRLWQPWHGLVALVTVAGLAGLAGPFRRGRALPWGWCAAAVFAVLFVGVYQMLPGYARKFGMRGQVRRHLELAADSNMPVICYPHRWDSVSFYLRRGDVRSYGPAERDRLFRDLKAQAQTLVFIKSEGHLRELLRALPDSLEFQSFERQGGNVTSGLIRRRPKAASGTYAHSRNEFGPEEARRERFDPPPSHPFRAE